jgi:hypothetical protein
MTTREQLTHERFKALIRLIIEDGASPEGEIPADHVRALARCADAEPVAEVARRHRHGDPPQSVGNSNGGGRP